MQIAELLFTYSDGVTDSSIALRSLHDGRWVVTIAVDLYDKLGVDGVDTEFATRGEAIAFFKAAVTEVVAGL